MATVLASPSSIVITRIAPCLFRLNSPSFHQLCHETFNAFDGITSSFVSCASELHVLELAS